MRYLVTNSISNGIDYTYMLSIYIYIYYILATDSVTKSNITISDKIIIFGVTIFLTFFVTKLKIIIFGVIISNKK